MTLAERESLFTGLFHENRAKVLRLCRGFLNSDSEAEDLLQEIMINVWTNLDRFEHRSSISTWLYRIAVNTALVYRRKRRRREEVIHLADCQVTRAAAPEPPPGERLALLRQTIAQLPPPDRLMAALVLDGLSYKEIAEIVGISVNYVGVRLTRLRKTLETQVKESSHG